MKNVIIAAGLVLIIVLTTFISLTIYSHNTRQNEVEEALTAAVEQALENLMVDKQYSIDSTEEFIADFTQRLILGINSESNITVNILAVDIEKGLLDVEVVEKYQQVNGSVATASYRKTVILEEVYDNPVEHCTVTFMVESAYGSGVFDTYKVFTLSHGSNVIFPGVAPAIDGYSFKGWSLTIPTSENSASLDVVTEKSVDGDLTFYAVFENIS